MFSAPLHNGACLVEIDVGMAAQESRAAFVQVDTPDGGSIYAEPRFQQVGTQAYVFQLRHAVVAAQACAVFHNHTCYYAAYTRNLFQFRRIGLVQFNDGTCRLLAYVLEQGDGWFSCAVLSCSVRLYLVCCCRCCGCILACNANVGTQHFKTLVRHAVDAPEVLGLTEYTALLPITHNVSCHPAG